MKEVKNNVAEIGNKVREVLSKFQEIEFAYCFGSMLKNDTFNDIDVALHVSVDFSPYERVKFSLLVGRELEKAIKPRYEFDVRVLNQSPLYFQYEVIKTGKIIFSRDKVKRVRHETQILSDYLDYRETSNWLDKEFLVRV